MIKFNRKEIELLLDMEKIPTSIKKVLREFSEMQRIELTNEQADDLRDICTSRYDYIGLDENYEQTTEGLILTSIIDKLLIR